MEVLRICLRSSSTDKTFILLLIVESSVGLLTLCHTSATCVSLCSSINYDTNYLFVMYTANQPCLTITAGTANSPIFRGIGFQSTPPLDGS